MLRTPLRIAADRRTLGFSVLSLLILIALVARAVQLDLPLTIGDSILVIALMLLGLGFGAGAIWSARTTRVREAVVNQSGLIDAVELAAVMVIDDDNIIRHWSRGCEELYGWTAAEAIGRKGGCITR